MNRISPCPLAKPIEEQEIRGALLDQLSTHRKRGNKVLEEFRIERGGARIDVAEIGKHLVGYEIKSDKDSFARFSNQIHAYNRVFDRINLVCGPVLLDVAEKIIPSWWGIVVAERLTNGSIQLSVRRNASANPMQDAFSLASLLWKEEALEALLSLDTKAPKGESLHTLWSRLATNLSVGNIRSVVAETLLKRQYYRELAVKTM